MALTTTPLNELGMALPQFEIVDISGQKWTEKNLLLGKPSLVVFMCNHCPYVQAIEGRLVQLGHRLKELGVPMLAISSNDPKESPEDSPEKMKTRAKEKSYSFPYAFDADQSLAKKFGAVCTPDFFLYDSQGKLAYRGRLDDSWKDESRVTRQELFEAVQVLLKDQKIEKQTPSMGCSIKWRQN